MISFFNNSLINKNVILGKAFGHIFKVLYLLSKNTLLMTLNTRDQQRIYSRKLFLKISLLKMQKV